MSVPSPTYECVFHCYSDVKCPCRAPLTSAYSTAALSGAGGVWRAAFKTNSFTEVAAALYLLTAVSPALLLGATAAGALIVRSRL
eukprot:933677-Prorocentrum_minimum.AAC.1